MQAVKSVLNSVLHLFYPQLCCGCGNSVPDSETLLCVKCLHDLPSTNYASVNNNPIEKIFFGRVPVHQAYAEYYFSKDSIIQHLIHQLKYKSNRDIGFYLGEKMGRSIIESGRFKHIDAIIPVPLHKAKEKKRGYNQAAIIAEGISSITQIPVITHAVTRNSNTQTQTRKHRFERWENMQEGFVVEDADILKGKKLLLVDDVLTTGATMEAFAAALVQEADVTIYMATLAASVK